MPSFPDKFGKRRGMGIASSGRYLRAAGALEATVELFGIDVVIVQPRTWKAALGLSGPNKRDSLDLIRSLYPDMADVWFKRQKDNHRAESCLLSIFGAARCDIISVEIGRMNENKFQGDSEDSVIGQQTIRNRTSCSHPQQSPTDEYSQELKIDDFLEKGHS